MTESEKVMQISFTGSKSKKTIIDVHYPNTKPATDVRKINTLLKLQQGQFHYLGNTNEGMHSKESFRLNDGREILIADWYLQIKKTIMPKLVHNARSAKKKISDSFWTINLSEGNVPPAVSKKVSELYKYLSQFISKT